MTGRTEKQQGAASCRFGLIRTLVIMSCLIYVYAIKSARLSFFQTSQNTDQNVILCCLAFSSSLMEPFDYHLTMLCGCRSCRLYSCSCGNYRCCYNINKLSHPGNKQGENGEVIKMISAVHAFMELLPFTTVGQFKMQLANELNPL